MFVIGPEQLSLYAARLALAGATNSPLSDQQKVIDFASARQRLRPPEPRSPAGEQP